MLVSDSAELIDQARYLATQAREPFPHYEHSVLGYNYRLSNLLAALGRAQLRGLDSRIDRRRRHQPRLPGGPGRPPGIELHAGGLLRRAQLVADLHHGRSRPSSEPIASRSAWPSSRWTSSPDRPGSPCISSRCSPDTPTVGGDACAAIFAGSACPRFGPVRGRLARVVETVLARSNGR